MMTLLAWQMGSVPPFAGLGALAASGSEGDSGGQRQSASGPVAADRPVNA